MASPPLNSSVMSFIESRELPMDMTPTFGSDKFQCPHCGVASQQTWFDVRRAGKCANAILDNVFYGYRSSIQDYQQNAITAFMQEVHRANERHMSEFVPDVFSVATCGSCGNITLWVDKALLFPRETPVAAPNVDMDADIQTLYLEAASIVVDSPRGATALLRLALQLLLKQLGKSGNNINNDIKELVSDGLSSKIQKALDLLRVVGNNAVHPGQIDLNDGKEIALKLFHVLNFIADEMITKPKELDLLYSDVVPDETKQHINTRDGRAG
jgi:hypothetical protein